MESVQRPVVDQDWRWLDENVARDCALYRNEQSE